YSGELDVVGIRVVDEADGRVLYADGFPVARYDGPVRPLSGSVTANYLPVGAAWTVGAMRGAFIPLAQFDQPGTEEAVIRLVSPTATPGEFRFTHVGWGS